MTSERSLSSSYVINSWLALLNDSCSISSAFCAKSKLTAPDFILR